MSAGPSTSGEKRGRVLVVDEERALRRTMRLWLEELDFEVEEHEGAESAIKVPPELSHTLACVDLGLGEASGIDLIRHLRASDAELPIVAVTASQDIAVEAMRAGAFDYVTKPLDKTRFTHEVLLAAERRMMTNKIHDLEAELTRRDTLSSFVGESSSMKELARQLGLADLPPEISMLARATLRSSSMIEAGLAPTPTPPLAVGAVVRLRDLERTAIEHALRQANGSVGKAAKLLGIGRATLYRRLASVEGPVGGPKGN